MNTYLWVKNTEILVHRQIRPDEKTVYGYWTIVEGLACITSYN